MTDSPLLDIADAVAEGREVDWVAVRRQHPELADEIDNLRALESLASRFAQLEADDDDSTVASPPAGGAWGHLKLHERIAAGSFGEVWRAFDPVLQREVALKLRRDDADSRASAREFISEARRLAKVRHPNILGVHGADIHGGRVGLWAELLDGPTLEQTLAAGAPVGLGPLLDIGRDLARALTTVHAAGLVHGDVKAANVVVEDERRAVLMDFGAGVDLASADHDSLSYGSPLSAAPERLEGAALATSADVWSLGVLLHRLATGGAYPFQADDLDGLRDVHRRRAERRTPAPPTPGPKPLRRLVDRMLNPVPDARPSAAEVADRLRWISHAPLRRRRRLAAAAIIGSLAIGAAAAAVGFVRARHQALAAETAKQDAEDVNEFLTEVLGAPRLAQGGRKVLVTEVLDGAAEQVRTTLPEGSAARARIFKILGLTYSVLGRLDQAEPVLRQAVAELGEVYGPNHPRTIHAEIILADTVRQIGDLDESQRLFADAEIRARDVPIDHPVHDWLRINLASAALDRHELDRAESLLLEARQGRQGPAFYGDTIRQSAELNLSLVWYEQGRYDDMIELLRPLATELEETRGVRNGKTLLAWSNLGLALAAVNRQEEARARFVRVAEIAEDWLGDDHPYTFRARANAAAAAKELGHVEQAAADEQSLLEMARRIFGPEHPATLQVESNLALSLKQLGETAEATRRMDDVAARVTAAVGPDHPLSYILAVNRAEIRLETGAPADALNIIEPARRRMAGRLGDGHPFVLAADSIVGAARCAVGDDGGIDLLESTLEAQREIGGDNDQQALLTETRLGTALAESGRVDAGRTMLEDVVDRCASSLADGHPLAVSARAALDALPAGAAF